MEEKYLGAGEGIPTDYSIMIVAIVESALILLFATYMTYNYAAKGRTPLYVFFFTICSLFLSFMIVFVVPIDIFYVTPPPINAIFRLKPTSKCRH